MNLQKIVATIIFLFIFSNLSYSAIKQSTTSHTSEIKLGKVKTKKKPLNKTIVYLMIAGLIIPLGAGYYIIKKK